MTKPPTNFDSISRSPEGGSIKLGHVVCGAWLLITTLLGLLSLLPWFGAVAFSAVMFDAGPDSELADMLVWVVLFPLLPVTSIAASWFLFIKRRRWTAALAGFACFVPVIWIAQYS